MISQQKRMNNDVRRQMWQQVQNIDKKKKVLYHVNKTWYFNMLLKYNKTLETKNLVLCQHVSLVVSDASPVVSLKPLSMAPCSDMDKGCYRDTSWVNTKFKSIITSMQKRARPTSLARRVHVPGSALTEQIH